MADLGEEFVHAAHAKGLELSIWIEPGVPLDLAGDANRLYQVLMNLLGNAVRFTAEGDIYVRVSPGPSRDSSGDNQADSLILRFEVQDTGIGIAAENQCRIFDSFIQADGSTTRRFGGTGLGLAICKRLVTMMHGQIGVESEPGRGSTF